MKEREFHLRRDLDTGGNMRRLYAYIRAIAPTCQTTSRVGRKNKIRVARLTRVK